VRGRDSILAVTHHGQLSNQHDVSIYVYLPLSSPFSPFLPSRSISLSPLFSLPCLLARSLSAQWAKSFVASTVAETVDISDLDEESRKILRDAVQQAEAADDDMEFNAYPPEYARYRIHFHADIGSVTLIEDGWLPGAQAQELCYMQFHHLDGQYQIRRDTYQYSFELQSIMIDDRQNALDGLSQIASCSFGMHFL